MPTLRILGSLNADLVTRTPVFPSPGETLTASSFTTLPGGKGANQAIACARLSRSKLQSTATSTSNAASLDVVEVSMVGAVGKTDGYYASLLRPPLVEAGIDVDSIVEVPDMSTGVAVIIVDESAGGENRILLSPGANWAGMSLPEPGAEGTGHGVLSRAFKEPVPDVMVLQAEVPVETVVGVIRAAKSKDIDLVFSPAPVPPEGFPEEIFNGLGHLVVNETEAAQLRPKTTLRTSEKGGGGGDGDDEMNIFRRAAEEFHEMGVRNVIITLGSKGVFVSSPSSPSPGVGNTATFIPAQKVEKVVDTTAAGDTFVGAYAVSLARWKGSVREGGKEPFDILKAVRWANKAAAVCVQRRGAMGSVPWGDEVPTE
jgi:ribokinase